MTAAAWAATGLILAGCACCAFAALPPGPVLRARYLYARHVRRTGGPARDDRDDGKGCMSEEEFLDFLCIVLRWEHDASAEGSRT